MANDHDDTADRLRRQQDLLAEFGSSAFYSHDLESALNRASELVAQGLDVKRAKVLELLPGGEQMLVRAGVNWSPGVVGHTRFGAGEDSPAGYALCHDEPVVSSDLDAEKRFEIPEVLREHGIKSMVNVIIAGKDGPFGVLEVDATNKRDFDEHDVSFLKNYANLLAAAIERYRSRDQLQQSLGSQTVLIRELEHRVKNMLALVQSIANQTSADEPAAKTYRDAFLGRLRALARAESLVFEDHAQEVELEQLVSRSIEPFDADGGGRLVSKGPSVRVPARSGRLIALVLHELGTNATKYGALSVHGGKVLISWDVGGSGPDQQVRLHWREEGGPKVSAPERQGFGTKLLKTLAGYELEGQAQLKYSPTGVDYELVFPINQPRRD